MTVQSLAGLAALLCTILLAAVWYWHAQYQFQRGRAERMRIRAEEADSWADLYQEAAKALADQIAAIRSERDTLRERNAHLQALHAERTRQLLAKNYTVIDRNIQWRRTGK